MGSTFVEFRNKGFEANDATIEIWLLFLVDEIDRVTSPPDWLKETREEWHLQATAGFGFGVMPGLDNVVTSAERRTVILDLSTKALNRLHDYGPTIKKDELNAIRKGGDKVFFTKDLPSEAFEKVGEYFIKLLREELKPDENDTRVFL